MILHRKEYKNGYVEWSDDHISGLISAHTTNGRYSFDMMRKFKDVLREKKKLVTHLPTDELTSFFGRHCKLTELEDNFYLVEEE